MSKLDILGFQSKENFAKFENKNFSILKDQLFLRNIKYKNIEILKLISFLVRDKNWNNYEPKVINSKSFENNNDLNFEFNLTYGDSEKIAVKNNVLIGNDSLSLISTGEFLTDFWTNRIGFNLLLPLEGVVGSDVEVTKTDNSIEHASFPSDISPDQPIVKFQELSYDMFDCLNLKINFKGIHFEMEDQRNWGDASYKIYSGSLLDPFPYMEKKKTSFYQEIVISIKEKAKISFNKPHTNYLMTNMSEEFLMPQVGIKLVNENEIDSNLNFDFLYHLVDFDNLNHSSKKILSNHPIYLIALIDHIKKVELVIQEIKDFVTVNKINLNKLLICPKVYLNSYQPAGEWPKVPRLTEYYQLAKSIFSNVDIFSGMVTNFTELNRKRPDSYYDGVNFSFTPIVHDASDSGVLDTPNTLPYIISTLNSFTKDTPIHIGPITLGMHFNPYGEKLADNKEQKRLEMAEFDPRHDSLISLNWSIAVLSQIVSKNTKYITYTSLTGVHGIFNEEKFKRPMFYFYEILLHFKNSKLYQLKTINSIFGLLILKDNKKYYLLSNTSAIIQKCTIKNSNQIKQAYLNKNNFDKLNSGHFSFFDFESTSPELVFQPLEVKLIEVNQ